jgi:hypothetical protein
MPMPQTRGITISSIACRKAARIAAIRHRIG